PDVLPPLPRQLPAGPDRAGDIQAADRAAVDAGVRRSMAEVGADASVPGANELKRVLLPRHRDQVGHLLKVSIARDEREPVLKRSGGNPQIIVGYRAAFCP